MKKYFFFLTTLLFMACGSNAQGDKAAKLSAFVEQTLQAVPVIPAISIAIVDENGPVYTEGFGFADVEQQIPATKQTNFYIASSTKPFNGLLATILAEEGQLDLNNKITEYLPFRNFTKNEVFKDITVMDLLSHQSGIDNPYLSFKLAYTGAYTDAQILELIEQETVANEDGKKFEYTNFGYYLFDVLLKAEVGKSWRDLLQTKVFQPLGMENTTAYISQVKKDQLALPYLGMTEGQPERAKLIKTDKTMHAAGGLVCNASDAARFLSCYVQGGFCQGNQVFAKELIEKTYAPQVKASHDQVNVFEGEAYGTGWRIGKFKGEKVVYHFGGYVGYHAHFSFLPESKVGVAIMVNHRMGMPIAELIAQYAYDLYLSKDADQMESQEEKLLENITAKWQKYQQQYEAYKKSLAERSWQLSLAREKYTGTFFNKNIGTLRVELEDEDFRVSVGKLNAIATAYTKQDCMRIELIPGSGRVLCFDLEAEEVKKINYNDLYFDRVE